MANRKGGFIGQDGLNAPDEPTGVSASAGDAQATVSFTAPSDVGGSAITGYNVQSDNGDGSYNRLPYLATTGKRLDYSAQAPSAWAFTLGDSGTKAYVVNDSTAVVYQYTLSTAYDISTASYASLSFNSSSQVTQPRDITFSPDGTKMYISADSTVDTIYQYTLSSAWDVSSATYASKSFSIGSQDTTLYGFTFNSDGTKIVAAGSQTDALYQYTLSTAYDISTASYDSVSYDVGTNLSESAPLDVQYSSDGSKLFLLGNGRDRIYQIDLGTPYDLSTASYSGVEASLEAGNTSPYGLFVKNDDETFYVLDNTDDEIIQYETPPYATSSPVTVTGLTNDTTYTFNVWAINAFGWSSPSDGASVTPLAPRALFFGGQGPTTDTDLNVIDYVQIPTTGNASDFGDIGATGAFTSALGNATRSLVGAMRYGGATSNVIQYVTPTSTGNTSDFGDLTVARFWAAGASNSTRGLFAGGGSGNVIDYVTIGTTGNAANFGDLTVSRDALGGASSPTRAVFAGGSFNTIDYVTIATTGNASDFGDLSQSADSPSGCSSSTRAIFGTVNANVEYITIASTGNATNFGQLSYASSLATNTSSASSETRGLFAGGLRSGIYYNSIDYLTIASTGNGTDFGDLTIKRNRGAGTSTAHGGLA